MFKLQGFTVVELIITILILALLATLAAPTFSNMIRQYNLERSMMELNMLLSKARSTAVTTRQIVTVHLGQEQQDTSHTKYWMPKGQVTYSATSNQFVFLATGHVKSSVNTNISHGFTDFSVMLCDAEKSKANLAVTITLSYFGAVQGAVKGLCI